MSGTHWATAVATMALALPACQSGHDRLVAMTGSEAKASCYEFVLLDNAQRYESYGLGLLAKMAVEGVGCALLPTTPGVPSEVVTVEQGETLPAGALEVVPPPEVVGVPVAPEETLPFPALPEPVV